MAKRFNFSDASGLAGRLFRQILNRNADQGGYDYVLYVLQQGKKSVKELMEEMLCSDEFIENIVFGEGAKPAIQRLRSTLGAKALAELELPAEANRLIRIGLKSYVEGFTGASEYKLAYGEDRMPDQPDPAKSPTAR